MLTSFTLSSLLLLASAGSLATASPIHLDVASPSVLTTDGVVDPTLVEREIANTFAKLERGLAVEPASSKPDDRRRACRKAKRDGTSVPVSAFDLGGGFTVNLGVGKSAQYFPVTIDTGSSDLTVSSFTGGFDSSKSSTFKDLNQTTSTVFLQGGYTGQLATDTVSLGSLSVPAQTFLYTPELQTTKYRGILGMGPQAGSQLGANNFFSNLVASGQVAANKFGLYLTRGGAAGSEAVLGGYNAAHINGIQTAVKAVEGLPWWALEIQRLTAGGKIIADTKTVALVDSGASISYLPKETVRALYAQIPGSRLSTYESSATVMGQTYTIDTYEIPCSTSTSDIGVVFTEGRRRTFRLNAADFNLGSLDDGSDMCWGSYFGVDFEMYGQRLGLLGIPFLKSYYSIFDFSANTITLGESRA
ncbi:hypothetical protein JCM10207_007118 [Rhodosporidiobolus poonsookiae]